jgi:hypothetical protein
MRYGSDSKSVIAGYPSARAYNIRARCAAHPILARIEDSLESLEFVRGESEITPVKQHGLSLPARGFQHEVGSAAAQGSGCAVD